MWNLLKKSWYQTFCPQRTLYINWYELDNPPQFWRYFCGVNINNQIKFIWLLMFLKNLIVLMFEFPITVINNLCSGFIIFAKDVHSNLLNFILKFVLIMIFPVNAVVIAMRFCIRLLTAPFALLYGRVNLAHANDKRDFFYKFFRLLKLLGLSLLPISVFIAPQLFSAAIAIMLILMLYVFIIMSYIAAAVGGAYLEKAIDLIENNHNCLFLLKMESLKFDEQILLSQNAAIVNIPNFNDCLLFTSNELQFMQNHSQFTALLIKYHNILNEDCIISLCKTQPKDAICLIKQHHIVRFYDLNALFNWINSGHNNHTDPYDRSDLYDEQYSYVIRKAYNIDSNNNLISTNIPELKNLIIMMRQQIAELTINNIDYIAYYNNSIYKNNNTINPAIPKNGPNGIGVFLSLE